MEKNKNNFQHALTLIVTISCLVTVNTILWVLIPKLEKDSITNLVFIIVNSITAFISTVLGYHYGSSKGSQDKTDLLKNVSSSPQSSEVKADSVVINNSTDTVTENTDNK